LKQKEIILGKEEETMKNEPKSFVVRCKEFFGLLPNQKLVGFAKELKELTDEDRVEFTEAFEKMGMPVK